MKVGALGTFVWDTIWTLADVRAGRPFETWGGVAYSLAAAAAARPEGWEVVPLARVGRDLADDARRFMAALPGLSVGPGILAVPEPNNRVELRYVDAARRGERLTGGVAPWTWDELEPRVAGLDALYVNFLSGFEMGLDTAERLRASFPGPLYSDLHSLFLGCPGEGERRRRRLPDWERWAACFDAVQLNADELGEIGEPGESMNLRTARVLRAGPGLVLVTRGEQGATTAARARFPARRSPGPLTGAMRRDSTPSRPGTTRSVPPRETLQGAATCGASPASRPSSPAAPFPARSPAPTRPRCASFLTAAPSASTSTWPPRPGGPVRRGRAPGSSGALRRTSRGGCA